MTLELTTEGTGRNRPRPPEVPSTARRVCLYAVVVVTLLGVALGVGAGEVAADEGFTVEPDNATDHRPGEPGNGPGSASYAFFGVTNVTIDYVEGFGIRWEPGVSSKCYRGDLRTYGIDRGDTYDDETVDEEAIQYTDGTSRTEDRVYVQFYPRNGLVGETTNLDAGDELVLAAESCVRNPDDPGWYRLTIRFNGTMEDGTYRETTLKSNYVWICDCENETAAREELGPPPNERADENEGGEATPTATETDVTTPAATPTLTAAPGTDTEPADPTATPTRTGTPTATAIDDDGAGADREDESRDRTPTATSGDGAGFGAFLAALAATMMGLLKRRVAE